ncbi:hypothetical protein E3N88_19526 [Mikania micrantha]|uniref:Peroxidase n=1 Tax=Mikania micrantha TaxID=192012 RepID=A0A5N6NQ39_9ASTR|nr:hypothetical protein E3N88_19526 [Mikania micrantha]
MGYHKPVGSMLVPILILLLSFNYMMPCKAQLSTTFYDATCPNALSTIQDSVSAAVSSNRRNAAFLIRLHFHDCFVEGCDASILLEVTGSEKAAPVNTAVSGYDIIDDAKAAVESVCPGVVSCADILTVAARDASVGGPSWTPRLGRRDSDTSFPDQAASDLPRANMDLSQLIANFDRKNLSPRDMVALSGSHTIGQARCATFRARIYDNASDIDATFASNLRTNCPPNGPTGNGNLEPLDLVTPNTFDNNYFINLRDRRGLLASDQVLFSRDSTDSIVTEYIDNPSTFESDFAAAMVRMSEIQPRTGASGVIRTVCTAA